MKRFLSQLPYPHVAIPMIPSSRDPCMAGQADGSRWVSDDLEACDLDFQHSIGPRGNHAVAWPRPTAEDETKSAPGRRFDAASVEHDTLSAFLQDQFTLGTEGETHGEELSFIYHSSDWWCLTGGYALLNSNLCVTPGGMDLNNALKESSDPKNQIALRSSRDLSAGIALDAHLRWVDTLVNNDGGQVGTVPRSRDLIEEMGIHLTDRRKLPVFCHIFFDDHHPEFGVLDPARVEIRRSVFGKVAWRF